MVPSQTNLRQSQDVEHWLHTFLFKHQFYININTQSILIHYLQTLLLVCLFHSHGNRKRTPFAGVDVACWDGQLLMIWRYPGKEDGGGISFSWMNKIIAWKFSKGKKWKSHPNMNSFYSIYVYNSQKVLLSNKSLLGRVQWLPFANQNKEGKGLKS